MISKRNLFIFLITFTFFIFSIIIGVNILYALSLSLVLFTIMVYFGTIGKDFSIVFFLISSVGIVFVSLDKICIKSSFFIERLTFEKRIWDLNDFLISYPIYLI